MKVPKNVKRLPKFLNKFPYRGFAVGSKIFFRSDIYNNLISNEPTPENVGILIHEQIHINRIKKYNWFIWGVKYWLSPRFRFKEELEATKGHMKYLKKKKRKFNISQRARHLSSWLYLWSISFNEARLELKKVWNGL